MLSFCFGWLLFSLLEPPGTLTPEDPCLHLQSTLCEEGGAGREVGGGGRGEGQVGSGEGKEIGGGGRERGGAGGKRRGERNRRWKRGEGRCR